MKVLLLQLFWLSFAVIGAAECTLFAKFWRAKSKAFVSFLSKTHVLVASLVALACGLATMALVVVPACLFEWQISVVVAFYFALLAAALAVFVWQRAALWKKLRAFTLTKKGWFYVAVVGLVLAAEYITSLRTGGLLAGDAQFELAQITLFAQRHLTLADPIFGSGGVLPTAYSVSIQHAVQALASELLGKSAAWVWFYSHAFVRLALWVSLFGLCWEFLDKKVRANWSYVVLLLLPFVAGDMFSSVELHNRVVFIWIALCIVGVKVWLERKSILLLTVGAVLVASAHPLNAAMCASYLVILGVVLLGMRLVKLQAVLVVVPIVLLLVLPMLLVQLYPHAITSAGFNDAPSSGPMMQVVSLGPVRINIAHPTPSLVILLAYGLFPLVVYAAKRLSDKRLRIGTVALAICGVLFAYTVQLVSLIGYVYLVIKAKSKAVKVALVLLVLYTGLIVYNPLVLSLAEGRIPLWSLARFQDFNMFALVAPLVGLLCLVVLPFYYLGYKKLATIAPVVVVVFTVVAGPLLFSEMRINNVFMVDAQQQTLRQTRFQTLEKLEQFKTELQGQIVFSDDVDLPAMVIGVAATNVLAIDNEANASGNVHIEQRKACAAQLSKTLSLKDLQTARVTRIVTSPNSSPALLELLKTRSSIRLLEQGQGYAVYAVPQGGADQSKPGGICAIPPPSK
ncbi:hypothetical protein EYC59_03420 [Candidatus Saccharibacteria bacterium]|nr:MAG: hypothetical protein EYC59_03420 [Candidatus Saccharibacteria bacterium]